MSLDLGHKFSSQGALMLHGRPKSHEVPGSASTDAVLIPLPAPS